MEFDELFCLMSVATCLVMSIAMLWLVIPPTMGDDVKRPELRQPDKHATNKNREESWRAHGGTRELFFHRGRHPMQNQGRWSMR